MARIAAPAGEATGPETSPFQVAGVRWWAGRGASAGALRPVVAAALDAALRGGAPNQKHGRRKELYFLELGPGPGPSHLLKVNHYPGALGLRRRLFGSKARRELRRAEAVAERGIPTPLPLAAGERREGLRVRACYLLVPFLRGAEDLRRIAPRSAERRALAGPFGRFARRIHDAGIEQDDFQPNNFLRGGDGPEDLWLIDCERVRLRRSALPRGERARLLAKLERELPAATLTERARFLRAYAGGERGAWRGVWRDVEAAARKLAAHDAARLERMLRQPSRRFVPFAFGPWQGVRAPDCDAQALEAYLGRAHERDGEDFLALSVPDDGRGAPEGVLARAILLARRGLGPQPAALLRPARAAGAGPAPKPHALGAHLVLRAARSARLSALPPDTRRAYLPALARLLERLAALGRLTEPRAEQLGLASPDAPLALQLLDPSLLEPGAPAAPGERAARRALAFRLVGGPS